MTTDPLKVMFEADAAQRTKIPGRDQAFQIRVIEAIQHRDYRVRQLRLLTGGVLTCIIMAMLAPYLSSVGDYFNRDTLTSLGVMITLPAFILLFRKGLKL